MFPDPCRAARNRCFSRTEPQADRTRPPATMGVWRDGDPYVLNGRNDLVTTGREASSALVFCQTDRTKGRTDHRAARFRKGTPGSACRAPEEKLGIRASERRVFLLRTAGCRCNRSVRKARASQDRAGHAGVECRIGSPPGVGIASGAY